MDKRVILITGGARSGKSRYAESRAQTLGERLVYIATAEAGDDEMAERIAAHKKRRGSQWITVEEPVELAEALMRQGGSIDCALVDCLTLWTSNLLLRRGEEFVRPDVEALLRILPELDFHVVFVTNEVGWGIVPDNALARNFRDLAGWTNQRIAATADEVVLMVSGIPTFIKKETLCS